MRPIAIRDLVSLAILTIRIFRQGFPLLIRDFGPLTIHLGLVHATAIHNSRLVVVAVLDLNGSLRHGDLFGLDRLLKLPNVFLTVRKVAPIAE